jgi:hypothetical protein
MNYQEYFDSLIEEDLYVVKSELLRILDSEYQHPDVINYDGMGEMVFDFLMSLEEHHDFDGILSLHDVLSEKYPKIYDAEFGYFADALIPYYLGNKQAEKAKKLFVDWTKKDYDYDAILITINKLIYYGKEDWIDAFIEQEYFNIRNSPRLIPGAESDLNGYKFMIELGKCYQGLQTLEEVKAELARYDIVLNSKIEEVLTSDTPLEGYNFRRNKEMYVAKISIEFQKYIYQKYQLPFLLSFTVMSSLLEYFDTSKYSDQLTYFKVQEQSFIPFLKENNINGLSSNIEGSLAMLYILPVLHAFLLEKGVFQKADADKERVKIKSMLSTYEDEYAKQAELLKAASSYVFD